MCKFTLAICLILSLVGCTVGPDYVTPDVESPTGWRIDYDEAAGLANAAWWKQFDDPVLDDLVHTALQNNKDVRIAAARVEEFAARLGITRSDAFPQVGYGASAAREQASRETAGGVPSGMDRTNDMFSATLNVGWELDLWGRIRRATEAARADLLTTEENRRAVVLTLVSAVATSYIDLRSLDKQLEITNQTLNSRGESLHLFELQFEGGVISDLELSQSRSEYEQAAVRIPPIERQIALTENSISVLLGRNPGPIARGKTIDDLVLPDVPEGVPSDLLERRPDIRAAEQQLIAANARIGQAKAAYFPTISLTGMLGFASDDLSNLASSSANVWNIGAGLAGPIFTGGRISSQVAVTEAVREQALVGYLQTIQTAFRETEDALVSTQKAREELQAQRRQLHALTDYARLARMRYDNGYVSYIEVLDAERKLFDAELTEIRVQTDVYSSLVSIYKAMGGGWVEHAEELAVASAEFGMYEGDPTVNVPTLPWQPLLSN